MGIIMEVIMKRMILIISLLVILAFAVTACSSSGESAEDQVVVEQVPEAV